MILKSIIILITFQFGFQQCTSGCLKCGANNACLICDTPGGYFALGLSCAKTTTSYCTVLFQDGRCADCDVDSYLDPTSLTCLKVPDAKKLTNCVKYTSSLSCRICAKAFLVKDGRCIAVATPIVNCAVHTTVTSCSRCDSGYILSMDSKQCFVLPSSVSNCLMYTYLNCRKCTTGFSLNKNNYLPIFTTLDMIGMSLSPKTLDFYVGFVQAPYQIHSLQVCQGLTDGCLNLGDLGCTSCDTNYFLENNKCIRNPYPSILNCGVYSDLVTCTACIQGFYFKDGVCTAVTVIDKCTMYDPTATTIVCTRCNFGFFVSSNACVARTNGSILGCLTLDEKNDQCLACGITNVLTSDFLACLLLLPNCITYSTSSKTAVVLTCQVCADGYYPNQLATPNSCVQGTLVGCQTYLQNDVNKCSVCMNTYYLKAGVCVIHKTISGCDTYDPVQMNSCLKCKVNFYKFSIGKNCLKSVPLPNCLTHSDDLLTCTVCMNKFYLNAQGVCVQIPSTRGNCLTSDATGSNCLTCDKSSILLQDPANNWNCMSLPNYLLVFGVLGTYTNNSQWKNVSPTLYDLAGSCLAVSYSISPSDFETICIKNEEWSQFNVASLTPNCKRYGWNLNKSKLVCMECITDHYISNYSLNPGLANDLTCVSNCVLPNSIVFSDLVGVVNICLLKDSLVTSGLDDGNCAIIAKNNISRGKGLWSADYFKDGVSCVKWGNTKSNYIDLKVVKSYQFDVVSDVPATPINPSYQTLFLGFHFTSTSLISGVFNYAGVSYSSIDTASIITNFAPNCNAFYMMGEGSAYATVGRNANLDPVSGAVPACIQCKFGFQPTYTSSTGGNYQYSPICAANNNCNVSIIYGGLPTYLNGILSCHSCQNNNVLTLYMEVLTLVEAGNSGKIVQYSVPNLVTLDVNHGFRCMASSSSFTSLVKTSATETGAFTNCAVYGVFTMLANRATVSSTIQNYCLACATGFYPIYYGVSQSNIAADGIPRYIVQQCKPASNCDNTSSNKPFNSCGKCSTAQDSNSIFFAYAGTHVVNCLQSKTANCFILDMSVAGSPYNCWICKVGYYLNRDGICEIINLPNFNTGFAFSNIMNTDTLKVILLTSYPIVDSNLNVYELNWIRLQNFLTTTGGGYGSTNCKSGYIASPIFRQAPILCVGSAYLATSPVISVNSNFVPNCANYKSQTTIANTGKFQCFSCNTGFIVDDINSKCVSQITNCLVVRSADNTKCQKCAVGFFNLNGVCNSTPIFNCLTHLDTADYSSSAVLRCSVCQVGYSLNTNSLGCTKGTFPNCQLYTQGSTTDCLTCISGYSLVLLQNSVKYCYQLNGTLEKCIVNVNSVSANQGFQQGVLSCTSCIQTDTDKFALLDFANTPGLEVVKNACLKFDSTSMCLDYDANATLAASTLKCKACASGYYLMSDSKLCLLRTVVVDNCMTYDPNNDKCLTCKSTFLLINIPHSCIPFPTGFPKCTTYSNLLTCTKCISGYYLKNNVCTLSTVVANCLNYSEEKVCMECSPTFFLNADKACVAPKALNCLTYSSINACLSCSSGNGLSSSLVDAVNVTSCVDSTVINCVVSTSVSPFTCITCNAGYYNVNGTCTAVTTVVVNCLTYSSAILCSKCSPGYVLSNDMTKCDSDIFQMFGDSHCDDTESSNTAKCSICQPNYKFVNGACTPVSTNTKLCAIYNPYNSTECLVCTPKIAYMNNSTQCVSLEVVIYVPSNNTVKLVSGLILLLLSCLFTI